ncbi:hypothetical protein JTB14_032724 [Gonioctena quinquepunctata]|nr:hypothetical protein JTB14_032724 [Gonioctena quinquepunctata]
MFNRIRIPDEDNFSRGLDPSRSPDVDRMTAMLFGTTSSPFLAQFVKNYDANQHSQCFGRASEAIIHHHYVDDYLDGTETEEEAVKLIKDVIYVHSKADFEIRNSISDSLVVLEQLPENSLTNQIQSEVDRRTNEEKELKCAMNIEIPICYSLELKRSRKMEIHTFSDASELAYSTAIYLRLEFSSYIDVILIASKAREAPLKTLKILLYTQIRTASSSIM